MKRLTARWTATAGQAQWYALVDLAFDEGRKPWPLRSTPTPLYRQGRLAPLQAVSPMLCEIPTHRSDEAERIVYTLNRHAAGRPMLSFVASTLSAPALADAMHSVLEVETSDGQSFLLRIADTRVVVTLPSALTTAHWAQVHAPLTDWLAVDRSGELVELPMPTRSAAVAEPQARIRLDDAELAALLQAGEADALIGALADGFADAMPRQAHAAFHLEVNQVCALARAHGLISSADVLSLALVNRLAGGELWRDPRVGRWLAQHAWPPGQFADSLGAFVETLA